jgi:UDP:flavonoid glycosyltransferase YjiC (YdhE family)
VTLQREFTGAAAREAASARDAPGTDRPIVLATLGSLGDLHPFMAVGLALKSRGGRPIIATAEEYRAKVVAAGLEFHAVRPSFADIERDLGMSRAELTRRIVKRIDVLFRRVVLPYTRGAYDDILPLVAESAGVVTSTLAFGARYAAEKLRKPSVTAVLQPMIFASAYDPPKALRSDWLHALFELLGVGPTAAAIQLAKFGVGRLLTPLQALRHDLGLPPSRANPLFEGQFSPDGTLALYSRVLGDVQPDFPASTLITGFASYDSEDGRAVGLEARLAAWLEEGPAPLVFTLGSVIVHDPGSFFAESLAAARALGRRALLLVGEAGLPAQPARDTPDVFVCAYAPHSLVFPRAAAVVHQAGIGTLANALKSGRPELIVPFYADQIDNAARAERLGLARVLNPRRYTAARAAAALESLFTAPAALARAADIGGRVAAEHGASVAADFVLQRFARRRGSKGY